MCVFVYTGGDSFATFAQRMRIRCTLLRSNPFLGTPGSLACHPQPTTRVPDQTGLPHLLSFLPCVSVRCHSWNDGAFPSVLPNKPSELRRDPARVDEKPGLAVRRRCVASYLRRCQSFAAAAAWATSTDARVWTGSTVAIAAADSTTALL